MHSGGPGRDPDPRVCVEPVVPQSVSGSAPVATAPAAVPQQLPFLLTDAQGEAARTLLGYVLALPLPGPDAQLLAVVVAIRAARGGVGNVTGADLSALRLTDAREAVAALRGLGWRIADALLDGDPATPVPVTVPDLERETDHPLPFGKTTRTRVSGWTARTLAAKPVRKLPPAARLAALVLAAHSTSGRLGQVPPDLPDACRAALPDLERKGFLVELAGDRFLLAPEVRHLAGMRPPTDEEAETMPDTVRTATGFRFDAADWSRWKDSATPALRRHVEAVERCALCELRPERVAEAFTVQVRPSAVYSRTKSAYGRWKETNPDRGPLAAAFTVTFRDRHGHGPSFNQLCEGLGWDLPRPLRVLVVQRLLAAEWLADTAPVPWTLRPGPAARAKGISLPGARNPVPAGRS